MPARISSSLSGKLPQGGGGRSSEPGRPGLGRLAARRPPRRARAARRHARRAWRRWAACGYDVPRARQGAAANGQPERDHPPPAHEHPEQAPARAHVPVPAARLADVLGGDPHPLVALGREEHLLDQTPVLLLDVGAVRQRAPRVLARGRPGRRAAPPARPATAGAGRRGRPPPSRSPCGASSSRTAATARPPAARPGRAACGARRARREA